MDIELNGVFVNEDKLTDDFELLGELSKVETTLENKIKEVEVLKNVVNSLIVKLMETEEEKENFISDISMLNEEAQTHYNNKLKLETLLEQVISEKTTSIKKEDIVTCINEVNKKITE